MAVLNIYNLAGTQTGTVEVKDSVFGIEPNQAVLHEVLTAELAAARQGTAATKTRAMVRGGGRKPFKQKGTGRARQGTIRAPHMVGGGVTFGPHPRSYEKKVNKKVRNLALRLSLIHILRINTEKMVFKYDFLIIGAGVAGMSYALKVARAHKGKVCMICKT